jgi:hypothetical protein
VVVPVLIVSGIRALLGDYSGVNQFHDQDSFERFPRSILEREVIGNPIASAIQCRPGHGGFEVCLKRPKSFFRPDK